MVIGIMIDTEKTCRYNRVNRINHESRVSPYPSQCAINGLRAAVLFAKLSDHVRCFRDSRHAGSDQP